MPIDVLLCPPDQQPTPSPWCRELLHVINRRLFSPVVTNMVLIFTVLVHFIVIELWGKISLSFTKILIVPNSNVKFT